MPTRRQPRITPEIEAVTRELLGPDLLDGREESKWKRGSSGNPKGRPVEPDNLTDMLIHRLGKSGMKRLADHFIELALTGGGSVSLQATMAIYDRIEGKPRQAPPPQGDSEPLIAKLLRGLIDDNHALTGHVIRTANAVEAPRPYIEAEARSLDSE